MEGTCGLLIERMIILSVLTPCFPCKASWRSTFSMVSRTSTCPHSVGIANGPCSTSPVFLLTTSSRGGCATSELRRRTSIGRRVQRRESRGNIGNMEMRSRSVDFPHDSCPMTTREGGRQPRSVSLRRSRSGSSAANTALSSWMLGMPSMSALKSGVWFDERGIPMLLSRSLRTISVSSIRFDPICSRVSGEVMGRRRWVQEVIHNSMPSRSYVLPSLARTGSLKMSLVIGQMNSSKSSSFPVQLIPPKPTPGPSQRG
mmetsp:Transcript_57988/g.138049  ORF Transcript_57988/g.138049 Transcript_57988/m.138049 type:complete len:258 (-) Transcript_57988:286-1059(-)